MVHDLSNYNYYFVFLTNLIVCVYQQKLQICTNQPLPTNYQEVNNNNYNFSSLAMFILCVFYQE